MHQYATIEDTVYFWFGANDTAGSGADGATPVYDVRLAGAAVDAAPVLSGAASLLTHADYPAGAHEVAIAATAANGFAAGNVYSVFCTLLVDSQNPTGFVGSFSLKPVVANVTQWLGTAPLALSSQQVQAVVPTTQKVDVETIKTQTVTCGAGVTVLASVGTAATSTAQTGDAYAYLGTNLGALGENLTAVIGADGDTLETLSDQLDTATADIYTARVDFRHNEIANADEYLVYWYKNGVIQTTASSGKIGVQKADAGGTALVTAATAMTALTTTGAFFFSADNSLGKRWVVGQALVTVKATIDAVEHTDYAVISRQLPWRQ